MKRERYHEEMGQRHYDHDCRYCEFLISVWDTEPGTTEKRWLDIYHSCDNFLNSSPILIRYGNEPGQYITSSGLSESTAHLQDVFENFFNRVLIRNTNPSEDDQVQAKIAEEEFTNQEMAQ